MRSAGRRAQAVRDLRPVAAQLIEDRLSRAERVLSGEEPLPEGWEEEGAQAAAAYARTVGLMVGHWIQFAAHLGLFDYVRDRELLFSWGKRAGALQSRDQQGAG